MFDILNILFNFPCGKSQRSVSELRWLLVLWENDHQFNDKDIILQIYIQITKKESKQLLYLDTK